VITMVKIPPNEGLEGSGALTLDQSINQFGH
jgi:hypothetical protein